MFIHIKLRKSQISDYLLGISLKPFLCVSSWRSEEEFITMLFLLCSNITSKCDHFVCRWLHGFFWLVAQHPRNLFSRTTSQQWAPPQKNRRWVKIHTLSEVVFYCSIIELVGKGLATCARYWRGAGLVSCQDFHEIGHCHSVKNWFKVHLCWHLQHMKSSEHLAPIHSYEVYQQWTSVQQTQRDKCMHYPCLPGNVLLKDFNDD